MSTHECDSNDSWDYNWNKINADFRSLFSESDFENLIKLDEIAFYTDLKKTNCMLYWICLYPKCKKKFERFHNLKKHIRNHIKVENNYVRRSYRLAKKQN
jgi:hypothetical protein